jgi:hypothetical protein
MSDQENPELDILYSLQMIVEDEFMDIVSNRNPRDRGGKRLQFLDIFSSFINGNNERTACFLDERYSYLYIAVNENDDPQTHLFAREVLFSMQKIMKNFNAEQSDVLLTKILIRNLNRMINYVKGSKFLQSFAKILSDKKITNDVIDLFAKESCWKFINAENIFHYVKESDNLYEIVRSLDEFDSKDSILHILHKIAFLRWYYVKIMRRMIHIHKLGRTSFSSIKDVIQVPVADKLICSRDINYNPSKLISELCNKYDINYNNSICAYIDIKLDNSTYDNIEYNQWNDELITTTFNGSMHAEMSLITHLMKIGIMYGEIGVSKPCCLSCYMFMKMLTCNHLAEFIVSGSYDKFDSSWTMPQPEELLRDIYTRTTRNMIIMLYSCYMKQLAKKNEEEVFYHDGPLTIISDGDDDYYDVTLL